MMRPSISQFVTVRGLRYHLRCWGDAQQPLLVMLHGWMDVSASFQFVVDALQREWFVVAPDFRGFGLTERPQDGYWFADYLADLDAILLHLSPQAAVNLVGHSMGGNVAALYAGIRPERVAQLANLEGFGLPATQTQTAPERLAQWLQEIRDGTSFRPYATVQAYADRLMHENKRLSAERALFVAQHSTRVREDGVVELLGDPRHKRKNATLYRLEEAKACWRRVQAPTLWVAGAYSHIYQWHQQQPLDYELRKACFRRLEELVIEDCGHMLHHDQPQQLAQALERFFYR